MSSRARRKERLSEWDGMIYLTICMLIATTIFPPPNLFVYLIGVIIITIGGRIISGLWNRHLTKQEELIGRDSHV